MKKIKGDIFEGEWDSMAHCCNLYHTWGAGIVVPLRKKYPSAYEADKDTPHGETKKLGWYSFADTSCGKRIYNLYAQVGVGNNGKPTSRNLQYDHLFNSMYRMLNSLSEVKDSAIVATPLIGGGLAGGNRQIILTIMDEVFKVYPQFEHHLYEL